MKANEAPEKLYLSKNIYSTFVYQVPDPDDKTAVEYTRTDAFIEKAKKWIKEQSGYVDIEGDYHWDENWFDDFIKAIEL